MNAAAGEMGLDRAGSADGVLSGRNPLAVADAAAVMAGEQSSGTFIDVPGEPSVEGAICSEG